MPMTAFTPAQTLTASATSTSSEVIFSSGENPTMEINNAGAELVFVRWGTTSQTALETDYPVLPGSRKLVSKGNATRVAVICPAGTATVYFTLGVGDI